MSILVNARLVESLQEGRRRYYRLAGDDAPDEAQEALAWASKSRSKTIRIKKDTERIE